VPRELGTADSRGIERQKALLDRGRLVEIARHDLFLTLDLGEALVLDADSRVVCQHGQELEIVGSEFPSQHSRVDIDQTDDTLLGLERHGHHRTDVLLADALCRLEGLVERRVPHEYRRLVVDHAVADTSADPEALSVNRARDELSLLDRHQHAALGAHRLVGEIEDHAKELVDRPVTRQLAARLQEGGNRGVSYQASAGPGRWLGLVQGRSDRRDPLLAGEHVLEASHDRVGRRAVIGAGEELDALLSRLLVRIVDQQHQVPGGDLVSRAHPSRSLDPDAIEKRTVLALEIADRPALGVLLEDQVVAREARVARESEIVVVGPTQGEPAAIERYGAGRSLPLADL
jgi:hypothetical protein